MPVSVGTRDEVLEHLVTIRERIGAACGRAGRDAGEVRIVAAAKTVPVSAIRWVVEAGLPDIGHNYVQELRESRPAVPGARWHFIGTLQTGSAHLVAANADVVQTLASPRSAERLARRAAGAGRRLQALIEVDLTGERSGVPPDEVPAFARRVAGLEGVELTGLMTLPPIPTDPEDGRPFFVRLRELRDRLREDLPQVVELSMGMSLDYEVAAEEGATMVRIGTALFGPRTPQ
jgi:pyridoxal phosphate enzyme (YggS family)